MIDFSALSNLKDKDLSSRGLMVLEGRIVIEKALERGIRLQYFICSDEGGAAWLDEGSADFPVIRMPHAEICDLVGFRFHHGAVAVAGRPALEPFPPGMRGRFLCLWNVTDPSNVGALIRSAAGLNADGVLLGGACADPYYRKSLRASMGNAFSLPLFSCDEAVLREAGRQGTKLVAATLSPEAVPIADLVTPDSFILLLGNEGYGLPGEVTAFCDHQIYIPMRGGVDSLNVVVAGGICMYELFRDRHPVTRP